jgi:large subunit ribosomal protein L18
MKRSNKDSLLQKRRWRIRKKIKGTAERPRLAVHFSNKNIYAQCIDDTKGHTLVFASTLASEADKANNAGASILGQALAEKAVAAGVSSVVFDRSGRRYHGCVKSFAEAAREGGLKF